MQAPRHPCVPFGGSKLPFLGFADCDDSDSDWPPAFRNKRGTNEKKEKIQKISLTLFGTEHLVEKSPAGIELESMTYDDYPVETSRDDAHKEQEFPEFLGGASALAAERQRDDTTAAPTYVNSSDPHRCPREGSDAVRRMSVPSLTSADEARMVLHAAATRWLEGLWPDRHSGMEWRTIGISRLRI